MRGASLPNLRVGFTAAMVAAGVCLFALVFAVFSQDQPLVSLAIPAVLLTALACARWPTGAIGLMIFFSGTFGSLQAFGLFSPGPLVDLLIAGLWVSVLVTHVVRGREQAWWIWPGMALACLYIVITFFEIATAVSIPLGLLSFRYSTWYMLVLPVLALAGWRLSMYERIGHALVATTVLVAGYAVVRLIIGPSASEESFSLQSAGGYNVVDDKLALVGSFPSRHSLAFWVTCAAPLSVAAALTQKRLWRVAGTIGAGMCIAAALGTQVRAALPALVVGMATVVVLHQLSGGLRGGTLARSLAATVLAVGVGGMLFVAVLGDSSGRYNAIFSPSGDVSYEHRITKWGLALEDVENDPFGKGLGTAGRVQETRLGPYLTQGTYGVDSSYLKIVYEQGFPMLALFLAAMFGLLVGLVRYGLRATTPQASRLAIGGAGTMVAAMGMFVTGQYIEDLIVLMLWIPVGAAIGALAAERASAGRPAPGAG